jgi:molecular chaperone DnaJ
VSGATCPDCAGTGVRNGRAEVDVQVPSGVRDGTRLRLRGLGGPGNPPGDLFVKIGVTLPAGAHFEGDDVHADIHLMPAEAARGITVRFAGQTVNVPAGTPDGGSVTVPGRGLGQGDLIVTVRHDFWRGVARAASEWLGKLTDGGTEA